MTENLKQFNSLTAVGADDIAIVTPTNVKLGKGQVLDIYNINFLVNFVGSAGVGLIFVGLTNCRVSQKVFTSPNAGGRLEEILNRKCFVSRRLWRFTVLADTLSDYLDEKVQFVKPYTVWDTPHFIASQSGVISNLYYTDCEIHGVVRSATDEEIRRLQDSQRPLDWN